MVHFTEKGPMKNVIKGKEVVLMYEKKVGLMDLENKNHFWYKMQKSEIWVLKITYFSCWDIQSGRNAQWTYNACMDSDLAESKQIKTRIDWYNSQEVYWSIYLNQEYIIPDKFINLFLKTFFSRGLGVSSGNLL